VRWRGVSLYALVDATVGNQIYNSTKQRLYQHYRSADLDQFGKAEDLKKPVQYYDDAVQRECRQQPLRREWHVREAARGLDPLRARPARRSSAIGLGSLGMERVTLGLIGRNLFTFTNYDGFDPEVGNTTLMTDSFAYPNFRTITAMIEVQF
jgi:hypothetical protein